MKSQLTLSPILFHWNADRKLDFYARIADEAPVDVVYLGEVICSKRTPFFEKHYDKVAERLTRGGKKVVFSSLAEVMLKRERNMIAGFCDLEDYELEINDSSALWHLDGKSFRVGSYMNVYNEDTMAYLAKLGATHFCLPPELPATSVEIMAQKARQLGVTIEVQVFGRVSLALSARCYHARAHKRIKDNCQFVCEEDLDGMALNTLDQEKFLTINGIQTLSHSYLNLLGELAEMKKMAITHYRLVPHTLDMVAIAKIFREALDHSVAPEASCEKLGALDSSVQFSNGFWHGQPGHQWMSASARV